MTASYHQFANTFRVEASFNFMFLGSNEERAREVRVRVESLGCFQKVAFGCGVDRAFDGVAEAIKSQGLASRKYPDCLIVMVDFAATDEASLHSILEQLVDNTPWAERAQVVVVGLTESTAEISMKTLVNAVAMDFAFIGTTDECFDWLDSWCAMSDERVLAAGFRKAPSQWLRCIRHDYIGNAAGAYVDEIQEAGMWADYLETDFWQNALRNVLVTPNERAMTRSSSSTRRTKCEVVRQIDLSRLKLVVPHQVADGLKDLELGRDFVVYDSVDAGKRAIAEAEANGDPVALIAGVDSWRGLRRSEVPGVKPAGVDDDASAATHVPIVIVSDNEALMTWSQWQQAFAANVVGSFSTVDFMQDSPSGDSLARRKREFWKAFCFRPLSGAVDRIVDLMVQTADGLSGELDKDGYREFYLCAAQVHAARKLYFV